MRPCLILLSVVFCSLFGVTALAEVQGGPQSQSGNRPAITHEEDRQRREVQPGATQGAALTNVTDAQPKFNMDYFVGEWNFESTVSARGPSRAGGDPTRRAVLRNFFCCCFF